MLKKIVYSTLVFLLLRTTVSAVLGHRDFPFLLTKLIGPTAPEQGTRMPLAVGAFHNGKIDAVRALCLKELGLDRKQPTQITGY